MTSASTTDPGRVDLFGVPIDALTMDETVSTIRAMVGHGRSVQHVCVNAAKLVEVERNPALADVIRGCDVVSADGTAVVWASRLLGKPLPERVAGIDLFERLVTIAAADGDAVYFLGARQAVVEEVVDVFTTRHPGLKVAGLHDGYWRADEEEALVDQIRAACPAYLFLAIPSPRKELWLNKHRDRLAVPFIMGVGGSFDVVSGNVGRAPRPVQRAGMEWAWRLGQEPRRLWRRYLYGNAAFLRMTVRELLVGPAGVEQRRRDLPRAQLSVLSASRARFTASSQAAVHRS